MNFSLHRPVAAAILAFGAAVILPGAAQGAAAKGEFGIKGIGATDCATVVREFKAGTPNTMMYGGWLYGYMTAQNQVLPDTFDLASWQDLNTLSNFLIEYCAKNPRTSFAQAVFNMGNALKPTRLKSMSQPLRITRNDHHYVLYSEIITRMETALAAKGLYKGKPAAKPEFSDDLARALQAFQARSKLPATGEPDQLTLFRLFQ